MRNVILFEPETFCCNFVFMFKYEPSYHVAKLAQMPTIISVCLLGLKQPREPDSVLRFTHNQYMSGWPENIW